MIEALCWSSLTGRTVEVDVRCQRLLVGVHVTVSACDSSTTSQTALFTLSSSVLQFCDTDICKWHAVIVDAAACRTGDIFERIFSCLVCALGCT